MSNSQVCDALAGALEALLQQVEQMKGLFDDGDGSIQRAIDDAVKAQGAYRSATASAGLPATRRYMVIGAHDDGSRFADSADAETGEEAERIVLANYHAEYPSDDYEPDIFGTVFVNDGGEMEVGS